MTREELLAAIKAADAAYYEKDASTITDEAYDALRREYIDKYGSADLDYTPGQGSRDEEARDCLNIKKRDTVGRTGDLRSKASENPKPREIV